MAALIHRVALFVEMYCSEEIKLDLIRVKEGSSRDIVERELTVVTGDVRKDREEAAFIMLFVCIAFFEELCCHEHLITKVCIIVELGLVIT